MKREQAKIIGGMSDEQMEMVSNVMGFCRGHIDEIIAYGKGAVIEFKMPYHARWTSSEEEEPRFLSNALCRIATPKITFNGVEIDAPIRDYDSAPEWIYITVVDDDGMEVRSINKAHTNGKTHIAARKAWATAKACQLYRDTHNKMMGIVDE